MIPLIEFLLTKVELRPLFNHNFSLLLNLPETYCKNNCSKSYNFEFYINTGYNTIIYLETTMNI